MAFRIDANTEYYSKALAGGDVPDFTAGFSFAGWFQRNADRNTYSALFSIFDASSNYWTLATEADGTSVYGFWNASTGARNTSLFASSADTWYYVAGAHVINEINMQNTYYHGPAVTGALATTSDSTALPGAGFSATTLEIGRDGVATEWLNGTVGPLKFWSVALTQAELEAERWQVTPVRLSNLYAFYPFLSAADTLARADHSVNARTLSGGTGSTAVAGPPVPWVRRRRSYFGAWSGAGGAPAGRTTLNTRSHPLGIRSGVGWRMTGGMCV